MKRIFVLRNESIRHRCADAVFNAPDNDKVTISQQGKSRDQEEKYHSMFGDISKVALFMGKKQHRDDWKRLLVDAFSKVMRDAGTPLHHDGRVMPSLDFERVVQLGIQTKDFYVAEASQFIEYLYSFGAENGVVWTEPKEAKT